MSYYKGLLKKILMNAHFLKHINLQLMKLLKFPTLKLESQTELLSHLLRLLICRSFHP